MPDYDWTLDHLEFELEFAEQQVRPWKDHPDITLENIEKVNYIQDKLEEYKRNKC